MSDTDIALVIGFLSGITLILLALYLGRCSKCGSWRNWAETKFRDDHHMKRRYEESLTRCAKCGHIQQTEYRQVN